MDVAINTVFGVMSFHGYTGMYMVGTAFYDDRHSVWAKIIVCNIHVCTCKPISEFHSPDFDVQKIPRAHLPTPHLHSL